jgi:hypothetical protein|tara:strand:+ start:509 stop:667 length:159 start_codon:yes stop_codon:yes gene_type:complete
MESKKGYVDIVTRKSDGKICIWAKTWLVMNKNDKRLENYSSRWILIDVLEND